jgi:hypothetical protein
MSIEDIETTETLTISIEALILEKRLLAEKERELIKHLQKILNRIGYEVVRVSPPSRRKTVPLESQTSPAPNVETQPGA